MPSPHHLNTYKSRTRILAARRVLESRRKSASSRSSSRGTSATPGGEVGDRDHGHDDNDDQMAMGIQPIADKNLNSREAAASRRAKTAGLLPDKQGYFDTIRVNSQNGAQFRRATAVATEDALPHRAAAAYPDNDGGVIINPRGKNKRVEIEEEEKKETGEEKERKRNRGGDRWEPTKTSGRSYFALGGNAGTEAASAGGSMHSLPGVSLSDKSVAGDCYGASMSWEPTISTSTLRSGNNDAGSTDDQPIHETCHGVDACGPHLECSINSLNDSIPSAHVDYLPQGGEDITTASSSINILDPTPYAGGAVIDIDTIDGKGAGDHTVGLVLYLADHTADRTGHGDGGSGGSGGSDESNEGIVDTYNDGSMGHTQLGHRISIDRHTLPRIVNECEADKAGDVAHTAHAGEAEKKADHGSHCSESQRPDPAYRIVEIRPCQPRSSSIVNAEAPVLSSTQQTFHSDTRPRALPTYTIVGSPSRGDYNRRVTASCHHMGTVNSALPEHGNTSTILPDPSSSNILKQTHDCQSSASTNTPSPPPLLPLSTNSATTPDSPPAFRSLAHNKSMNRQPHHQQDDHERAGSSTLQMGPEAVERTETVVSAQPKFKATAPKDTPSPAEYIYTPRGSTPAVHDHPSNTGATPTLSTSPTPPYSPHPKPNLQLRSILRKKSAFSCPPQQQKSRVPLTPQDIVRHLQQLEPPLLIPYTPSKSTFAPWNDHHTNLSSSDASSLSTASATRKKSVRFTPCTKPPALDRLEQLNGSDSVVNFEATGSDRGSRKRMRKMRAGSGLKARHRRRMKPLGGVRHHVNEYYDDYDGENDDHRQNSCSIKVCVGDGSHGVDRVCSKDYDRDNAHDDYDCDSYYHTIGKRMRRNISSALPPSLISNSATRDSGHTTHIPSVTHADHEPIPPSVSPSQKPQTQIHTQSHSQPTTPASDKKILHVFKQDITNINNSGGSGELDNDIPPWIIKRRKISVFNQDEGFTRSASSTQAEEVCGKAYLADAAHGYGGREGHVCGSRRRIDTERETQNIPGELNSGEIPRSLSGNYKGKDQNQKEKGVEEQVAQKKQAEEAHAKDRDENDNSKRSHKKNSQHDGQKGSSSPSSLAVPAGLATLPEVGMFGFDLFQFKGSEKGEDGDDTQTEMRVMHQVGDDDGYLPDSDKFEGDGKGFGVEAEMGMDLDVDMNSCITVA